MRKTAPITRCEGLHHIISIDLPGSVSSHLYLSTGLKHPSCCTSLLGRSSFQPYSAAGHHHHYQHHRRGEREVGHQQAGGGATATAAQQQQQQKQVLQSGGGAGSSSGGGSGGRMSKLNAPQRADGRGDRDGSSPPGSADAAGSQPPVVAGGVAARSCHASKSPSNGDNDANNNGSDDTMNAVFRGAAGGNAHLASGAGAATGGGGADDGTGSGSGSGTRAGSLLGNPQQMAGGGGIGTGGVYFKSISHTPSANGSGAIAVTAGGPTSQHTPAPGQYPGFPSPGCAPQWGGAQAAAFQQLQALQAMHVAAAAAAAAAAHGVQAPTAAGTAPPLAGHVAFGPMPGGFPPPSIMPPLAGPTNAFGQFHADLLP